MRVLKDLLTTPVTELGRVGRFLARQYKLWSHCFRLLDKNRAAQLAAALSYYTIFGIIPLAIFWVYITWVIVLFGLQLAFAIQHFETLELAETPKATEAEGRFIANDMTVITVAREVAAAFESGRAPVAIDDLCSRLDIPGEFGGKLLDELVRRNLLARTAEPSPGFTLIRDPSRIMLSEIADAVAAASFGQPKPDEHKTLYQVLEAQRQLLAHYSLKELLEASAAQVEGPSQVREDPQEQPPASDTSNS
jgi:DNA-binding IscR family transcriptional regulator